MYEAIWLRFRYVNCERGLGARGPGPSGDGASLNESWNEGCEDDAMMEMAMEMVMMMKAGECRGCRSLRRLTAA